MPPSASDSSRSRLPLCNRIRKAQSDRTRPRCSSCRRPRPRCACWATGGPQRRHSTHAAASTPANLEPQFFRRLERLEKTVAQVRAAAAPGTKANGAPRLAGHGSNYYVSNVLWSILASEVKGLSTDLLNQPDVDEATDSRSSSSDLPRANADHAILGFYSKFHSLRSLYPSPNVAADLFSVFGHNVAPLICIFHTPTLSRTYWDALACLDAVDADTEALIFAIHYSAVASLGDDRCRQLLGSPRHQALEEYRFGAEQALARAGLLTTQSMVVLQAAIVFLTALRSQDETRTTWSLTALVYHTAQSMGLHRDGEKLGLSPFETEMRRRVWWHICILDNRSAEYHGFKPIVQAASFDTKVPRNVNDDDLHADMITAPSERWNEVTDMTMTLVRCEVIKAGWRLGVKSGQTELTPPQRRAFLQDFEDRMRTKFLRPCEQTGTGFHKHLIAPVLRLITARFWMVLHYPTEDSRSSPEPARDKRFEASVQVLDISNQLFSDPQSAPWSWYSRTHIQWGAMGFVLTELCSRPNAPESERVWAVFDRVYDAWKIEQNTSRENLALPIRQLTAKARMLRGQSVRDSPPPSLASGWSERPKSSSASPLQLLESAQLSLPMTTDQKMALWQRQDEACEGPSVAMPDVPELDGLNTQLGLATGLA